MNPKYLFIGGPADGQWIAADKPQWRVVERKNTMPTARMVEPKVEPMAPFIEHAYAMQRLCGGEKEFTVYVQEGTPPDAMIALLLKGYRQL